MKISKSQSNEIKDLSDCLKRAERFLSYVISIRDYFRTKNESELDVLAVFPTSSTYMLGGFYDFELKKNMYDAMFAFLQDCRIRSRV